MFILKRKYGLITVCCAKFIACQLLNVPGQKQNPEFVGVLVFDVKNNAKVSIYKHHTKHYIGS